MGSVSGAAGSTKWERTAHARSVRFARKEDTHMVINVLKKDITAGVPLSACDCPVARALLRQTGDAWDVRLGDRLLVRMTDNKRIKMPEKVLAFAESFDRGFKVKPFELSVRIPSKKSA